QGAAPAAVEVTLGSLEVQPVSLQGASAWFKQHVQAHHRNHQHQKGDKVSGANEPVTLNATEDAMALVWGVTEEVLRLMDMNSSSGVGPGAFGEAGGGGGGGFGSDSGSSSDEFEEGGDGSDDEWYDAFGSEMDSGFQEQEKTRWRGRGIRTAFGTAAAGLSRKNKKEKKDKSPSGRPPFLRRRRGSPDSASSSGGGFGGGGGGVFGSS
ncbi:unnamed protein product, partial [Hapterophycus canaliculatus]